jgi:hypothetical protein
MLTTTAPGVAVSAYGSRQVGESAWEGSDVSSAQALSTRGAVGRTEPTAQLARSRSGTQRNDEP